MMYCIIQEIENKKDKFNRPMKTAYKITLRESYRKDGKVKAAQWTIATIGYYELMENGYDLHIKNQVENIANEIKRPFSEIYKIVKVKMDQLLSNLISDYIDSKEYFVKKEVRSIVESLNKKTLRAMVLSTMSVEEIKQLLGEVTNELLTRI